MHLPTGLAAAVLLALPCTGLALTKSSAPPPPSCPSSLPAQFFPNHHSQRVKLTYGPFTVPSMHEDNGMKAFEEASTQLPCTDCLITWMQADLEYADDDGTRADAATGMWLHHTVFSNLQRETPMCPTLYSGDRFFASGNERTPVDICAGGRERAGYYIAEGDVVAMQVELMNMRHAARDVVLTVTFEFVPGVPRGFRKVRSYWLDVGGCGSSSVPAEEEAAFEFVSPLWESPDEGRVTFVASHLHDGGTHAEVRRNGEVICDSVAVYGNCMAGDAVEQHITRMGECTRLGKVRPGDEWSVTAYYNTSEHMPMKNMDGSLEPVMGIALVYVAEGRGYHGHGLLKVWLSVAVVALALWLVGAWMRMQGKSFGEICGGWKSKGRVVLEDVGLVKGYQPLLGEEYRDEE